MRQVADFGRIVGYSSIAQIEQRPSTPTEEWPVIRDYPHGQYNEQDHPPSSAVLSPNKEADVYGNRDLLLSCAMSAEKYDECIKLLKKAGAGNPAGRSYHAAFGPKDKLMVFDVWTSRAAFDKFGKTLMPILQQLGIDPGQPSVMPVHKVIVPAAKVTSPRKQAKARRKKR